MPITDPGHLFVVHGDLTTIRLDAVAIPTDIGWDVGQHWKQYVPQRGREPGWAGDGVSRPTRVGDVVVRYVDSGFTPQDADDDELGRRVEVGARALAAEVSVASSSPGTRAGRPVIGMPLFGLGAGGFATRRGGALRALGSRMAEVARSTGVDVALVCFDRADYTALQSQADGRGWDGLTDAEVKEADRLGRRAVEGSLALFLGAGVSMDVGLPNHRDLLQALGATSEMLEREPADAAADLLAASDDNTVRDDLITLLRRHEASSLQHSLLASLRVEDVITTNFDSLYERAARCAFDTPLAVLPWSPPSGRAAYLLKLHGDPVRDPAFVLTREHFNAFASSHTAERAVLQALTLMGRELLFVGYSLQDANVRDVLIDTGRRTNDLGATAPTMATVLDVAPPVGHAIPRVVRLGLQRDAETTVASRRLEIFLDRVAWAAASEEASWVLDRRYEDLVSTDDNATVQGLRGLAVPAGAHWSGLRTLLGALGRSVS